MLHRPLETTGFINIYPISVAEFDPVEPSEVRAVERFSDLGALMYRLLREADAPQKILEAWIPTKWVIDRIYLQRH